MKAMILEAVGQPLRQVDWPVPRPQSRQVLIQVSSCGVCRTDLHILDGELSRPKLPLILGHQIVGTVVATGDCVSFLQVGDRVGIPWLGSTCGCCSYCDQGRENLCDRAQFTGYHLDGGYAEYTLADEQFCLPIPNGYPDLQAAPLLCAGLIGYRSLRVAGNAQKLGFYGFGSAAHILTQVACFQGRKVYAFTRPGDTSGQAFARQVGAIWAGDSDQLPPEMLDAAVIFAPVGELVPLALRAVAKGGKVICAGIHMSDIPSFPYKILWEERSIHSIANLTRQDGLDFLAIAPQVPISTAVEVFPLEEANEALSALRQGRICGSAVLHCN